MVVRATTPVQEELGFTPRSAETPNCSLCPSALTSAEARTVTGKGIGVPICAQKLLPLIAPQQSIKVRERVTNQLAKGCKFYGQPRPEADPMAVTAPIMFGTIGIGIPNGQPTPLNKPGNCNSCVNYVPPTEVASKTDWNGGLCLAKGKLLMPDRLRAYAQACGVGSTKADVPERRASFDMLMLNPEYATDFGEIDRAALARKSREIDPNDWPSDKPLTDDDKRRLIKAWREIKDPEGEGASIYIPIFHVEKFSDEERRHIPRTGDPEHPELYHDHGGFVYRMAVFMMALNLTPAAWGPPGVGKTELGRHLAWLMCVPFTRISITESTENDDLIGKMMYDPQRGTYFQDGRLTTAWSRPGVICLDEPNTAQNAVWQMLRPLTDNSKQLVLDTSDGASRDRHEDCWFYLAMNPAWDPRNVGTHTIGDADARRLLHLYMDLPPEKIEREIIVAWCKTLDNFDPTPHLDKLMKIAADIRPLCESGTLPMTWGLAQQIKVARLLKWFSPMAAFETAVLSYLAPHVAQNVVSTINTYYS